MPFDLNTGALTALVSVIVIDLVLAGDNAVVVAMAAGGLPADLRRRVIFVGMAIATVARIILSLVAMRLLAIVGLTIAGGILLLWVAWKLYRDLRAAPDQGAAVAPSARTFRQALLRVVVADVSMSLDNALAVAGTARNHLFVLVAGLLLSVALTAVASTYVARLLTRYRWIAWVGLAIVTAVALHLIYDGSATVLAGWSRN